MSLNAFCNIFCLLLVVQFLSNVCAENNHRRFAEELVSRLRRSYGYSVGYGGNCACSSSSYPTTSHASYTPPQQTSYSTHSCSGAACGQSYQPQKTSYHWCTGTACNKQVTHETKTIPAASGGNSYTSSCTTCGTSVQSQQYPTVTETKTVYTQPVQTYSWCTGTACNAPAQPAAVSSGTSISTGSCSGGACGTEQQETQPAAPAPAPAPASASSCTSGACGGQQQETQSAEGSASSGGNTYGGQEAQPSSSSSGSSSSCTGSSCGQETQPAASGSSCSGSACGQQQTSSSSTTSTCSTCGLTSYNTNWSSKSSNSYTTSSSSSSSSGGTTGGGGSSAGGHSSCYVCGRSGLSAPHTSYTTTTTTSGGGTGCGSSGCRNLGCPVCGKQ